MNDNDELESIWKDVFLNTLGRCFSSILEKTEENKKNRTTGVPVRISTIQLYRTKAAHTVRCDFVIISGFMLRTVMRG